MWKIWHGSFRRQREKGGNGERAATGKGRQREKGGNGKRAAPEERAALEERAAPEERAAKAGKAAKVETARRRFTYHIVKLKSLYNYSA